ncbi:hypothetical protein Goklo_020109 [Gossypium klotzschianum]|uniref:Uncharacterized protein n=1 Tax=Gossypium klotzschianum TaxID=34286 RepID=A0A7J8URM8_9ROSI|nr:hypothetical protein [Gossypium klotzschianum]
MSIQSTWKAWLQLGKTRAFSSFSNSDKQTAQVSGVKSLALAMSE